MFGLFKKQALIIIAVSLLVLLPVVSSAFYLGVCTHMGRADQPVKKDIELLAYAGTNTFRDDVPWVHTEQLRGQYTVSPTIIEAINKSARAGIRPLLVLALGNPLYDHGNKPVTPDGIAAFVRYASAVARQLRGKVPFYEVWNEWDYTGEPDKTPESYFQLLRAVYPAIKAEDPDAKVIAGVAGMRSDWLVKLASLGVMRYADGISMHAYVQCETNNSSDALYRGVLRTISAIEKAGRVHNVPIYISEIGWPTHTGQCGIPEQTAGQYVAQSMLLVRTIPSVQGLWWYDLKDDGKDRKEMEQNFGLTGYDYSLKPGFSALRDIAPYLLKATRFVLLPENGSRFVGYEFVNPASLSVVAITGGGVHALALWSRDGHSFTVPVKVRISGDHAEALHTGLSNVTPINGKNGAIATVHVPVDGFPTILKNVALSSN